MLNFPFETEWSFKSIERIKYLSKTHARMLGVFGLSAWGWSEYGRVRVVVHSIAIVISIVPIRRVRVVIIIYRVVSRRASSFSWNQITGPWGFFYGCIEYFISIYDFWLGLKPQLLIGKLKVWSMLEKSDQYLQFLNFIRMTETIDYSKVLENITIIIIFERVLSVKFCVVWMPAVIVWSRSCWFITLQSFGTCWLLEKTIDIFTEQATELNNNHWDNKHFQKPRYNLDKDFR